MIFIFTKSTKSQSNKMGQIVEKSSSAKLAKKSSSAVKKASSGATRTGKGKAVGGGDSLNLSDPKVQSILLVGLLAVLALALWFGFTNGCFSRRRRRRRSC